MECPNCKTELIEGRKTKEIDGTEGTELICPKCKGRFADIKIPYSALLENMEGFVNEYQDNPEPT